MIQDTKGQRKVSSNDTFFVYICFSGVKTVEETYSEEVYYCGPDKICQTVF